MTEEPARVVWPVVVVTDLTGRVTYWNAAAEQLLGWSSSEAIGQSIVELCLPDNDDDVLGAVAGKVRRGEAWHGQLGLRDKAGDRLDLATIELPIVDGRGQLVGVLGMSLPDHEGSAAAAVAQAEARAELAAERLGWLQRISTALSRTSSLDGVCDIVLAELMIEAGVTRRGIWLLEGQRRLVLFRAVGSEDAAGFADVPLDSGLPGAVAVTTCSPVFIESVGEGMRLYPTVADRIDRSYAALPLIVDGNAIGLLGLGFDGDYRFDPEERRFLMAIADQTAQAIGRARLFERETRAAGRLAFLAHASVVLAGSLDQEETLSRVIRLAVPSVADLATVYLYDERGNLRRAALAHRDPEVEANILRYQDDLDYEMRSAQRAAAKLHGASMLLRSADSVTDQVALDAEHDRILGSLRMTSALLVPLTARGGNLGMLSLVRVADSPPFQADDREFVEELARRAAIALDNARLHDSRITTLRTLQSSLLPPQLPDVPRLDLAATYHPAAEGVDVGGDFYDVFAVPGSDGLWAVTIGDVCGRGALAAARTGQVRHTVRALARAGLRGREVVDAVNAALLADSDDEGDAERFCTLLYGEARVGDDGVDLTLVCAGHPAPIVVRAVAGPGEEQVALLDCSGSLVGVLGDIHLDSVQLRLKPGDSVVFITDGIVEARAAEPDDAGNRGFFEEQRLLTALREVAGADAATQVSAVEKAVLTYSGGALADDAAVLVLRADPRR